MEDTPKKRMFFEKPYLLERYTENVKESQKNI